MDDTVSLRLDMGSNWVLAEIYRRKEDVSGGAGISLLRLRL